MITLTKAEERIMQILWDIKKGFINDIQDEFPEPTKLMKLGSKITRLVKG
jgi:predicted transcriptional regulator